MDRDILWAILNSNLLTYYYQIKNESKHLSGGYFGMDIPSIKNLPIIVPSNDDSKLLKEYIKDNNVDEINRVIYNIYNITPDEVKIIEGGEND